MNVFCTLGGHEASAGEIYNAGYYFSRCRRCGIDMVRMGASWSVVPRGHRVAWKSGCHQHSIATDFAGCLPVLHREANLPAVRPSYASWNRDLLRVAGAAVSYPEAAAEKQELSYPYLLAFAAVIGAGLQFLLGFGGGQGRPW